MEKIDPIWNEENLRAFVRTTFFEVQRSWCAQDLDALSKLLDRYIFSEWKSQIEMAQSNKFRNVIEDLQLNEIRFVSVLNYRDHNKDCFTVCIDAAATDYTVDASNQIINSNRRFTLKKSQNVEKCHESFEEFWTFVRHDNKEWRLVSIDSSDEWRRSVDRSLVNEEQA